MVGKAPASKQKGAVGEKKKRKVGGKGEAAKKKDGKGKVTGRGGRGEEAKKRAEEKEARRRLAALPPPAFKSARFVKAAWLPLERRDNYIRARRDAAPRIKIFHTEALSAADLLPLRADAPHATISFHRGDGEGAAVEVRCGVTDERLPVAWRAGREGVGTLRHRLKRMLRTGRPAPLSLLSHQEMLLRLAEEGRIGAKKGLLLNWAMGSGKTFGAAFLVACAGADVRRCVVVASNTNLSYWESTLAETPQMEGTRTTYEIMGYSELARRAALNPDYCRRAWVLVDECQMYRNLTPAMRPVVQALRRADQVVCLSGTPLVNGPEDIAGAAALICGEAVDVESVRDRDLREMFKGRVHFYDPGVHTPIMFSKRYPTVTNVTVRVSMTWDQALEHQLQEMEAVLVGGKRLKLPTGNSYHTRTHQAMNYIGEFEPRKVARYAFGREDVCDEEKAAKRRRTEVEGGGRGKGEEEARRALREVARDVWENMPKARYVLRNLELHYPSPQVVHGHFVESSVLPLAALVRHKHPDWRIEVITGCTGGMERARTVSEYNEGRIHVLFITDASATGTDIKGTRAMHKLGQPNNLATERQTSARCVRYGSHAEGEPITLYSYIATFGDMKRAHEGGAPPPPEVVEDAAEALRSISLHHNRAYHRAGVFDGMEILRGLRLCGSAVMGERSLEEQIVDSNVQKQRTIDRMMDMIRAESLPATVEIMVGAPERTVRRKPKRKEEEEKGGDKA